MPSLKLQLAASVPVTIHSLCTIQIGVKYVCITTSQHTTITGFELFELDVANSIDEYKNCFLQSSLLKTQAENSKVVFNVPDFLIVPNSKFKAENISSYISCTYGDVDTESIINCADDSISSKLSMQVIYRIKSDLFEAVNNYSNNAKYFHVASHVLNNLFNVEQHNLEKIKIQFYNSSMLVLAVKDGQLKLAQSYNFETPEDIIYYMLNIVQECSLSVESTLVEACGMIDTNAQHFNLLQSLFKNLTLEALHNQPLFVNSISVADAHYYTPFINTTL